MDDQYLPFKTWADRGEYPGKWTLYNWVGDVDKRDPMLKAGVIVKVNGRWLFNPARWREYCGRSAAA